MQFYLIQGFAFFLVYWLCYWIGVLACKGFNRLLKRPMSLKPELAGIGVVYSVNLLYLVVMLWVLHERHGGLGQVLSTPELTIGASFSFAAAIVPCLLFIMLHNLFGRRPDA